MTLLDRFEGVVRPVFIETGTCTGNTLAEAAKVFEHCISIEQNGALYAGCVERFKGVENVLLFKGNTAVMLRTLLNPSMVATFWLDAHYFENGDTLCPDSGQCPLLAELRAITSIPWDTPPIILIDDAFMFDESIPHPGSKYPFWTSNESSHTNYNRAQWPKIEEIDGILEGYCKTIRDQYILQYQRP